MDTAGYSTSIAISKHFKVYFDYGRECPRLGYNSDGGRGKLSFHISALVRNLKRLAILPPSHKRRSKGVSIIVVSAFVKVTKLMAAQNLQWLTLYCLFGQSHHLGNHRLTVPEWIQLTTHLPPPSTLSPLRPSTNTSTTVRGAFSMLPIRWRQTKLNCFLFRDWLQVASLPATLTIRPSTGVSTSVGGAIAKVTNVTAAQILKWLTI